MSLVKICEVLDGCCDGKKVAVRGWVYRKREGKTMIFLLIRDSTGVIQCTVSRGSPAWSVA
ncbi:MAG: OB-fold nucleic acid binding domain-containing protein, partial [Candidatus Bathyarchaeia archaeon]